jgi:HlyD family secretion protein
MANNPQRIVRFTDAVREVSGGAAAPEAETHLQTKSAWRFRKTTLVGLGMVLLLVASEWLPERGRPSKFAGEGLSNGAKTFRVQSAPTTRQLTIQGIVSAGRAIPVLMPFDGIVRDMKVQFGDRVNSGDVLLVLDSSEIETRLREARSGLLKAAMTLDALDHWETGPEVMRAKRALEDAEASFAKLERQVSETKSLLDRGIVARNEYETLVQQRDSQKLALAGAKQDVAVALRQGSPEGRQVAELDLENAKAKLMEAQRQFDGATVRAPASGIVLRPPLPTTATPASALVDSGSHVQRGQTPFMIADLASLVVSGKVDEIDINHIRIGQAVSITSDAFPELSLSGRIISGSAEADQDASAHVPTFNVRAAISQLSDDARGTIRIGMSARMTIDLAERPAAIVVPINSIELRASRATVRVVDQQSSTAHEQQVTLGATTPEGIEITSGLTNGDVLQIQ